MTESLASTVVLDAPVGPPWRRFVEQVEPLRPDLFRYCRYLTRSPWDAEDLVQECLARAFVTLAGVTSGIEQPRAWLFRVAYHIYLNQARRSRERPGAQPELAEQVSSAIEPHETREAAGLVITRLAPQERAALVLKEVFDFKLEEIADTLSTSVGAVKAALHRGRGKLLDPEPELGTAPHPVVLDAFVEAFNRRDLEGLTALLLESVVVEFPGLHVEYGVETAKRQSLRGVLQGSPEQGIAPSFRDGLLPVPPRLELRQYRGATILLAWFAHRDGDAVRALCRLDVEGDRVSHMRTYMHHPELVAEVCRELGVPFHSNGYRPWW